MGGVFVPGRRTCAGRNPAGLNRGSATEVTPVSHPSQQPRRFSEAEVAAILRRSAELQARRVPTDTSGGAEPGISLEQLQTAAAELGLRPEWIAAAAAEVDAAGNPTFWGGPGIAAFERQVDVK